MTSLHRKEKNSNVSFVGNGETKMMMQQQNYLSRLDFAKFLDVMPRLPIYHMDLQKPSVTPKELQMIAKIQYGCALSKLCPLEDCDIIEVKDFRTFCPVCGKRLITKEGDCKDD